MHKEKFILPGYLVGISSLGLITYRTLLAIGTDNKSILVSVNQYGEQYLDIACLILMWAFSIIGLLALSRFAHTTQRTQPPQRSNQQAAPEPHAVLLDVPRYALRNHTTSPTILHATTNIKGQHSLSDQQHELHAPSQEIRSNEEELTASRKR
jgi:hypothetical protein